jgi:NTE family protein
VEDFFDYTKALLVAILGIQESMHLHSDDWHRTLYIDTLGIAMTDFDISDARKDDLVRSGRAGAGRYFDEWYDNPGKEMKNRP